MLLRYTQAFLTQVAQTAACNGAHLVEQRCARWLLMTSDRVDGDDFALTHEFLAFMLGVRRAGVTVTMRALQDAGIISYVRGRIRIVDRVALEAASCECYRVVREHFERLLPDERPSVASSERS
jgi:CRP-like cAMP-binding protein